MSLLGFEALGRWSPGEFPAKDGSATLIARAGDFVAAGQPAAFSDALAAGSGSLGLSGRSAALNMSGTFGPGTFAADGIAADFDVSEAAAHARFAIAGVDSKYALGAVVVSGEFAVSAFSDPGEIVLGVAPAAFAFTGAVSNYSRNFEAWIWRSVAGPAWQAEATLSSPGWTGASLPFRIWTAVSAPANTWAPATIQIEPCKFERWRTK